MGTEQHASFEVWGGPSCSVGVEGSVLSLRFTPALELPFTLTCPRESPDPDPVPVPDDRGYSQVGGGLTALGGLATLGLWRRSRQSRF